MRQIRESVGVCNKIRARYYHSKADFLSSHVHFSVEIDSSTILEARKHYAGEKGKYSVCGASHKIIKTVLLRIEPKKLHLAHL